MSNATLSRDKQVDGVRRPLQIAFDAIAGDIGKWWALRQGFWFRREWAGEIFMEQHLGGRFFERWIDGEEILIDIVTGYAPPSQGVSTLKAPGWSSSTEVEVRFFTVDSGTRVEREHRGLERAAAEQEKSYSGGWDLILEARLGQRPARGSSNDSNKQEENSSWLAM